MIIYKKKLKDFKEDVFAGKIEDEILSKYKSVLGRNTSQAEINSWANSLMFVNNALRSNDLDNNLIVAIEYTIPQTANRIDFMLAGLDKKGKETILIIELKQWSSAELTDMDAQVKTLYTSKAPVFLKTEGTKLEKYILDNINKASKKDLIEIIDKSEIRPSKNLAEKVTSMLKGNKEFTMIDDQKTVYELVLSKTHKKKDKKKINLLVESLNRGFNSRYITKNSAPRIVYESYLKGSFKKSEISLLFTGSGNYINTKNGDFDLLLVDEAHRLNSKSGMFSNLGENQIKEIIISSNTSVFFIDENQKVTLKDIGTKEEIKKWAKKFNANIIETELTSQFRCNGSNGYLAWLDNTLQIKNTANKTLDGSNYDFKVIRNVEELHNLIREKNKIKNKARVVAGYCWDWVSKKQQHLDDIIIGNYSAKWNLTKDGMKWIVSPESIEEIGCIHSCQGLELDYIGVIIGDDFIIRDGKVKTNPDARAKTDQSIRGYKKRKKEKDPQIDKELDLIIKNTYRTLMTRGSKGCYIYCTDEETAAYFTFNS